MNRFQDRADAGRQLAQKLIQYKDNPEAIVIGLPRGGVVTAWQVSSILHLPLDIIVPRKIGAPHNPELALGALTQEGAIVWNTELMNMLNLHPSDVQYIIDAEKKEAQRRLKLYRGDRAPLVIKNKIVILVDDGLATGATMKAAIASVKDQGAQKIIVAIPVAPADTIEKFKQEADEVICLFVPEFFMGVGGAYAHFDQTTDDEVINLMNSIA